MPEIPHSNYEEMPAGNWEWEVGKDTLHFSNALNTILGHENDKLSHALNNLKAIVIPKYVAAIYQKVMAHLENDGSIPLVLEICFNHKDKKSPVCILFMGNVTERNPSGTPFKLGGNFIDITPHQQAEIEYRRVKDFLKKTNQTAKVGGWELDLQTNKVIWTSITKAIFEVPEDFIPERGSAAMFFKEGEDREKLRKAFELAVSNGITYDLELRVITAKGKELWTRTVGQPEFLDGKCVRLYGVFQDIDQHKKSDEAFRVQHVQLQQATAAKLEFLSIMSHEIRTPMNAVIGFTNLLLQDPREDQVEYLNVLKFSAENLLTLINDILDYNKIDAGKVSFEEVDFNVRELAENIGAAQQQEADKKELQLVLSFDNALPPFIKGDSMRLGQIITNLISNAIKFTVQGKVELTIRVTNQDQHKIKLFFEIMDTGIGIPEDKQDYIFEKFSQASSETTRKYGGTGLGLAICKRLLELVGSKLHVKSKPGEGASFFFELGFKLSEASAAMKKINYLQQPGFPGRIILIAEDNPINVMVVKKFLQQWQIACEVAENGAIAVEKIKSRDFDLVLMDLQMPVMDGYEATILIREMPGQKYRDLPIIALTASTIAEMEGKISSSGINDCVTKPFKPEDLYQKLAYYLSTDYQIAN